MARIDPEKVKQMHFKAQLEHTILVLNQINELDCTVLPDLIGYRTSCNQALAEHPTVQVGLWHENQPFGEANGYEVGLLGILNGLFGVKEDGYGYIAARFSDDLERIEHFELLGDEHV